LCDQQDVADSLALGWGVVPFQVSFYHEHPEQTIEEALTLLVERQRLRQGNTVVIISSISAGIEIVDAVQMRTV
jgi:pyruvate kinase